MAHRAAQAPRRQESRGLLQILSFQWGGGTIQKGPSGLEPKRRTRTLWLPLGRVSQGPAVRRWFQGVGWPILLPGGRRLPKLFSPDAREPGPRGLGLLSLIRSSCSAFGEGGCGFYFVSFFFFFFSLISNCHGDLRQSAAGSFLLFLSFCFVLCLFKLYTTVGEFNLDTMKPDNQKHKLPSRL